MNFTRQRDNGSCSIKTDKLVKVVPKMGHDCLCLDFAVSMWVICRIFFLT